MNRIAFLVIVIAISTFKNGTTQNLIDLPTAPRVDTTNSEIEAVYELWRLHLSNHPEQIYDNPFWSEQQKRMWTDYDISRRWTYGYEVSNGLNLHNMLNLKPRVLSIEKRDSLYSIRTLYAPNNLEGWQEIYTIQRVYAGKENGEWKLFSALPIITKNWKRKQVGDLLYVYPFSHKFNESKAKDSAKFVDSLQEKFKLKNSEPITYYLARNYDEMAKISGLDYGWDGNDGRGYIGNSQVFVGTGSESYPHELVHVIFKKFNLHRMISEGLATYYGGIGKRPFEELVKEVAREFKSDSSLTLQKAISGEEISAKEFYVGGAVLLKASEQIGGVEAVEDFLNLASTEEGIYEAMRKVLDIEKEDANSFWRNKIIKFGL